MKSLKNSNINPENLENLALIIPRDSGLAQSREIRDPVTRLESLVLIRDSNFSRLANLAGFEISAPKSREIRV